MIGNDGNVWRDFSTGSSISSQNMPKNQWTFWGNLKWKCLLEDIVCGSYRIVPPFPKKTADRRFAPGSVGLKVAKLPQWQLIVNGGTEKHATSECKIGLRPVFSWWLSEYVLYTWLPTYEINYQLSLNPRALLHNFVIAWIMSISQGAIVWIAYSFIFLYNF